MTQVNYPGVNISEQADDGPVAVLNHNRPAAYPLPTAHYERLINRLEDVEDAQVVKERAYGPFFRHHPRGLVGFPGDCVSDR